MKLSRQILLLTSWIINHAAVELKTDTLEIYVPFIYPESLTLVLSFTMTWLIAQEHNCMFNQTKYSNLSTTLLQSIQGTVKWTHQDQLLKKKKIWLYHRVTCSVYLVIQSFCFGLAAIINTYPWSCSSRNLELEPWRTQGTCLKVTSVPSHNGLVSNLLGCSLYRCSVDPTHIHCKWQKDITYLVRIHTWPISWKKRMTKNI